MIVCIGYLASLCLAFAMLVKNTIRSRWFNVAGIIFFIAYGYLVSAFPVIIANAGLLFINIYQLYKLYTKKDQFSLVEITNDNNLGKQFLEHYKEDIALYFPHFKWPNPTNTLSFMVLRNMEMANIFVATVNAEGEAVVAINYTILKFRDYKVGKFIFDENRTYLNTLGVKKMVYNAPVSAVHLKFLRVMGFKEQTINGNHCFIKNID